MIALVSAPTNLGLRPPQPGSVPGADKAPEALREAGLFGRLLASGARDAGAIVAGRYVDDDETRAPGHVRNEEALVGHARRLADRVGSVLDAGDAPVVVGGDCSVLVGIGLALARRGGTGLVHLDGHTDFRHPGNSAACASVAGEDLAAAVGLHWPAISDVDGLSPYFAPGRVAHLGHREDDEHAVEAREILGAVVSAREAREALEAAPTPLVARLRDIAGPGYWLQLDVDLLDPSVLPAVDSPDPDGLDPDQVGDLLRELAPHAAGASITVFDPDLDPDGRFARLLTDLLAGPLATVGSALR
ncbi:arginase [Leifsonia sp. LS1]|uniref:arginase family protein n=1 Tax=Leifsonia sp. LS1 TaxID=2828483 RepID=UPI001CFC7A65|nr:arginase family protein [Leifsonia sp. LS1]GIT78873.1 arginase [Leifsonia sp. LS1]